LGETKATLIGAKDAVVLDAKAAVDMDVPFVVDPWNAEDDLTFGLAEALEQALLIVVRMPFEDDRDRFEELAHGLVKFRLSGVALADRLEDGFDALIEILIHWLSPISGRGPR